MRDLADRERDGLDDLLRHAEQLGEALGNVARAVEGLDARITQLEQKRQIWEFMAFVRSVTVEEGPLVSVILATRNRSSLVPSAVASVLAQSYARWELIAVVDGSEDDTAERLARLTDPRIQVVVTPHQGLAAARNCGLSRAAGELVAYVDDDNTMHPEWLRSVVWAFSAWPDVGLLYGATLVDDDVARDPSQPRGLPWARFVSYESADVRSQNPTDIGSIAHRRALPEAFFDEELGALEDWDLLLRASEHHTVMSVPAIAGMYSTGAPDRLTTSGARPEAWRRLHAKHGVPLDPGTEVDA